MASGCLARGQLPLKFVLGPPKIPSFDLVFSNVRNCQEITQIVPSPAVAKKADRTASDVRYRYRLLCGIAMSGLSILLINSFKLKSAFGALFPKTIIVAGHKPDSQTAAIDRHIINTSENASTIRTEHRSVSLQDC